MMWLIITMIIACLLVGIAAFLVLLGASKMRQREIDEMLAEDKRALERQGMIK